VVYASTIFPSCIAWFLRGEGGVGFRRVYRRYGQTIHCASHPVSVVESGRFVPVAMVVDRGDATGQLGLFHKSVSYSSPLCCTVHQLDENDG
jgi:hypothetical protein